MRADARRGEARRGDLSDVTVAIVTGAHDQGFVRGNVSSDNPPVAAKYAAQFPQIALSGMGAFGGRRTVQIQNFAEGGIFDKIYRRR